MCELCMAIGFGDPCCVPVGLPGTSGTALPLKASAAVAVSGFEAGFIPEQVGNVRALIGGSKWSAASVTYSFPDSTADYSGGSSYGNGELSSGFATLTSIQKAAAARAFGMVSDYTLLTFSEVTGAQGNADIRMAGSAVPSTAWAYYPSSSDLGGDVWFASDTSYYASPTIGTYANHTFMHEIGHALGLKHGHDASGYGSLDAAHDSMEYSVMTYRSWTGAAGTGYTNEYYGYAQTFMAYDIAALQSLYGVNWSYNSGDTTYSFSKTTGEMFVNGAGVGAPTSNRIFRAIWDGGGTDTIDLSNYDEAVTADLNSGGAVRFSQIQTAQLAGGVYAGANLYLAVAPNNKKAALIDNIRTGAGDDSIDGNKCDNLIEAAGGKDTVFGAGGDDFIFGNGGRDRLNGGPGDDMIDGGIGRDWLKGGGGADTFVLNETSGKDVVVDFVLGLDRIAVPDINLATLGVSNTGHLTVEYGGSCLILRHLDWGDATLNDLIF